MTYSPAPAILMKSGHYSTTCRAWLVPTALLYALRAVALVVMGDSVAYIKAGRCQPAPQIAG